ANTHAAAGCSMAFWGRVDNEQAAHRPPVGYDGNVALTPAEVAMKPAPLALLLLLAAAARGDTPAVRYNRDVRPILSNRCFKCHGPDLRKSGLALQTSATATKKLRSGDHAIVPGDPGKSALIARVTSADPGERMPSKGDPLTPEQIATLKAWIAQGAKYEEH